MSRLIVEAICDAPLAAAGNQEPCYVVLSVISEDSGQGTIKDTVVGHYKVEPIIPNNALPMTVDIQRIFAEELPGTYVLQVVPRAGQAWRAGINYFLVSVNSDIGAHGQTLTSVTIH